MDRYRVTRRSFIAGALASGVALAGCASGGRGDKVSSSSRLRILSWTDYIDTGEPGAPGTVDRFAQSSRLEVDYSDGYPSNTEAFSDLFAPNLGRGRGVGFDVVVPTFWLASRLVARDWLEPLPLELLPNHVNLEPTFLTMPWDRGARFHMPWQAGLTGIAYNPALTRREVRSLADLFDPAFRGQVGMVTEMRETVALTMALQGADPSRPTREAAELALDKLEAAKRDGQIREFTGNEFRDRLGSGDFALCLAWSGDIVQLQRDRPDIRFVIPEEGGMQWFDTMVIPRHADNAAGAARWMDFVYEPANAARITAAVQYISPVIGVRDELRKLGGDAAQLADSPILFPDDETRQRLYTWGGLPADVEDDLDARFTTLTTG
ncbi:MAG TPA: spermidine/putrescine ABC transporter substrate-binding protein [Acidimicrobiales bacterium]|nr:spermidine/putrescine ABC transporter substrate-binding protein [Acidimicrobiales bacterium]